MSEESKSWYKMTRPLFNSGFEDDEFWAYGQDGFNEVLDSFIGSDVKIYDKSLHIKPQEVRAIIQNATSDVFNSTTVRQILCNIGILKCGQYVKDSDVIWMVSSFPDNNRIYEKAVLWKCKHSIRFISPITGEIVEYPVYSTNSTQYGTGEKEKTNISVGDDQHLIYIPYNEETIMLDDHFRFIMDKNKVNPTVYRITRVDPVSYAVGKEFQEDGLIQWSVIETQFNEERDSRDHMVADYYSPNVGGVDTIPGENAKMKLIDFDGDYMLAIGESKEIEVDCFDADGEQLEQFEFSVQYENSDAIRSVDIDGRLIKVTANHDTRHIGKVFELHVISEELHSEASIKIQIGSW